MNVRLRPADKSGVEARLSKVRREIQQRAWDLYCEGGRCEGTALRDWQTAEREKCPAALVSVAEEENVVRITVGLPKAATCDLALDVLPDEIVLETERNGRVEGYTEIHLPVCIDPQRTTATVNDHAVEVLAPKIGYR